MMVDFYFQILLSLKKVDFFRRVIFNLELCYKDIFKQPLIYIQKQYQSAFLPYSKEYEGQKNALLVTNMKHRIHPIISCRHTPVRVHTRAHTYTHTPSARSKTRRELALNLSAFTDKRQFSSFQKDQMSFMTNWVCSLIYKQNSK